MGDFLPRISVPDPEDMATVATALTEYVHAVACRGMMAGDLRTMVAEVQRASALLACMIDTMEDQAISAMFGDDENFAEHVEKLTEEMREHPDD